jgi:hypothetical protein
MISFYFICVASLLGIGSNSQYENPYPQMAQIEQIFIVGSSEDGIK